MKSWIICADTTLQYCGTRVLEQYVRVHAAGTSAGHIWWNKKSFSDLQESSLSVQFVEESLICQSLGVFGDFIHTDTEAQRGQAVLQVEGSLSYPYNFWLETLDNYSFTFY